MITIKYRGYYLNDCYGSEEWSITVDPNKRYKSFLAAKQAVGRMIKEQNNLHKVKFWFRKADDGVADYCFNWHIDYILSHDRKIIVVSGSGFEITEFNQYLKSKGLETFKSSTIKSLDKTL